MGMSYEYAGSASYPRFDEEVCAVVAVFGGVKTEKLKNREKAAPKGTLNWWFGSYISDDPNKPRVISDQIWEELKKRVHYDEGWEICA